VRLVAAANSAHAVAGFDQTRAATGIATVVTTAIFMSLLPDVENGVIVERKKQVKLKRPRAFKKTKYKKAKQLWREWWQATQFVRRMK
jgi:hypothetical protein